MFTDNGGWAECFAALARPEVSELQANGPDLFFIKAGGKREKLPISISSKEEYLRGIESQLVPMVDSPFPYTRDGYLFEGPLDKVLNGVHVRARVTIVQSPAASCPQVMFAKKSTSLATLDSIADQGSMAEEMKQFLIAAVKARRTIVFSGVSGAGKTTILEACSKHIPADVRIGVAEDTPELVLEQENVSYLHSVPWKPGMDPNNVATLAWVVQQFQRMRLDRAIVGETRGAEFAQFLVAANSGMEGSMTTIHADNPVACLKKMTGFVLQAGRGQPVKSVNHEIASAIDFIVQLGILPDGRHRMLAIQEVSDVVGKDEDAAFTTSPLYSYDPVKDVFTKDSQLSDKLRPFFANAGHPYEEFSRHAPGSVLVARNGGAFGASRTNSPGGGLPRSGGLPFPPRGA